MGGKNLKMTKRTMIHKGRTYELMKIFDMRRDAEIYLQQLHRKGLHPRIVDKPTGHEVWCWQGKISPMHEQGYIPIKPRPKRYRRLRQYKCPKCGSRNITPYAKREVEQLTICKYICEDCGHRFGPVVYEGGT